MGLGSGVVSPFLPFVVRAFIAADSCSSIGMVTRMMQSQNVPSRNCWCMVWRKEAGTEVKEADDEREEEEAMVIGC